MNIQSMLISLFKKASQYIDECYINLLSFFQQNSYLIIALTVVGIAVYGFELFNFNLTIDEEVHAISDGPLVAWIQQGRWGMYMLNKILLPYSVIPFVPLFMALVFHILAILILVHLWGNYSKIEKIIIGSICLAYPGIAYVYTFSTINYGIGFGLFCCALSLLFFTRNKGIKIFYATLPATFAVAIYQGFIPTILAVYLVYFINLLLSKANDVYKKFLLFLVIFVAAVTFSQIIQKISVKVYAVTETNYISSYFSLQSIWQNTPYILSRFLQVMFNVYLGDKTIYSLEVEWLGIILFIAAIGFVVRVTLSKTSIINKIFVIFMITGLFVSPFFSGFLMNGIYALRFLVALPIVISGIIALGININVSIYKLIFLIVSIFCVSQFMQSSNHLFASSYLALQADRLLGERIIERINDAKNDANYKQPVKYLEVIGYYERSSTQLIPKIETFGASFFEWDQGNVSRVLLFLQTVGYQDLQPLSLDRRSPMVEIANAMPNWPEKGSVLVIDDVVLIKFEPYSDPQKQQICSLEQNRTLLQNQNFCK